MFTYCVWLCICDSFCFVHSDTDEPLPSLQSPLTSLATVMCITGKCSISGVLGVCHLPCLIPTSSPGCSQCCHSLQLVTFKIKDPSSEQPSQTSDFHMQNRRGRDPGRCYKQRIIFVLYKGTHKEKEARQFLFAKRMCHAREHPRAGCSPGFYSNPSDNDCFFFPPLAGV